MFGCICPNNHMKRRCDKIFSVVNHNPCVGKILNAKKKNTKFVLLLNSIKFKIQQKNQQKFHLFQFCVRFLKKDFFGFFLLFCSCSVSLYHFNFHFEVCHVFLKCNTFGLFGMAAFPHIPLTRKCGKSSCMQIKHFKIRRFPKNSCQK